MECCACSRSPQSVASEREALQKDAAASRGEIEKFWRSTLQRAAREPLEAEVEPVKEPLPYRKFRITYRSLGNIRIRAYLGVPIRGEGPERRLPCVVTAPGYGGSQQGAMLDDCQRGYAVLQVYPRSQGESADLWKIDGPDKLTWQVNQPEGYYYQGAYVDVMRGSLITCCRGQTLTLREWEPWEPVKGAESFWRSLRSIRVSRPSLLMCRFSVICGARLYIPGALVKTLLERHGALNPRTLKTLDYFDPANLVEKLRAPVLLSAGGKDEVCPSETITSVFNRLPGIRSSWCILRWPHTSSGDFYKMGWEWMDRHLGH